VAHLGTPPRTVWDARRKTSAALNRVTDDATRRLGTEHPTVLERYADEAAAAGTRFVEIQNTMLFATSARSDPRSRLLGDALPAPARRAQSVSRLNVIRAQHMPCALNPRRRADRLIPCPP
jgi:hypothetical protein